MYVKRGVRMPGVPVCPIALSEIYLTIAAIGIIIDFSMSEALPTRMSLPFKKKAALRLFAKPGSTNYSAASAFCASVCNGQILFEIGAGAFWPQPKVESVVIELTPRQSEISATQRREYWHFLQMHFFIPKEDAAECPSRLAWQGGSARFQSSVSCAWH